MGCTNTKPPAPLTRRTSSQGQSNSENAKGLKVKANQVLPDNANVELCKFLAIPSDINQSKRRTIDSSYSSKLPIKQAILKCAELSKSCEEDQSANLENSKANLDNFEKDECKKIFDHAEVLNNSSNLKIRSITIYGENFIEAICTEFIDELSLKTTLKLSKGTKFNPSNCKYKRIDLKENEVIDLITCCYSQETATIQSLVFTTSLNNYCLVEREKSLSMDSEDSIGLENCSNQGLKAKGTESGAKNRKKSLKVDIDSESRHNSLLNINSYKDNYNKIEKSSPMIKNSNSRLLGSQSINLKENGKCLAGFKLTFGEYLENIEVYSIRRECINSHKNQKNI